MIRRTNLKLASQQPAAMAAGFALPGYWRRKAEMKANIESPILKLAARLGMPSQGAVT
jgi:hypothetical protein